MPALSPSRRSLLVAAAVCAFPAARAWAGLLEAKGVAVLDAAGASRAVFTSTERLSIQQRVFNSVASPNRIEFGFRIFSPTNVQIFEHKGNSTPGGVGNAAASVGGVPISKFFSGPGIYTLVAYATLDASTVQQQALFTVSSPNIVLVYPPNGAIGITEKPLTFRWNSSGAVKYRVTVGLNPSFSNSQFSFSELTAGGESSMSYPECQLGASNCMSEGTVYYWKVQGLNADSNVIAESSIFSFSVAAPSSQTRDLAVKSFEVLGRTGDEITFKVTVENRGATSEASVPLKFSLGGIPAQDSPVTMPMLAGGGGVFEHTFTVPQPSDQGQSLAIVCVELFDSDVPNNCKTMQVTRSVINAAEPINGQGRELTPNEICTQVLLKLEAKGYDVADYDCDGIEGSATMSDLQEFLASLEKGTGQVIILGPGDQPSGGGVTPTPIPTPTPTPEPTPEPVTPDNPLDPTKACEELIAELSDQYPELQDYSCDSVDRPLTEEDLAALLEAIQSGDLELEATGGGVLEQDNRPTNQDTSLAGPAPETPPTGEEDRTGEGQEWSGLCPAAGNSVEQVEIKGKRAWKKLYKRLTDQPKPPEVNFEKFIIVGVVAGGADHAEKAEVTEVSETPMGLRVRYRFTKRPEGAAEGQALDAKTPYHLKVVPKSDLKLLYERLGDLDSGGAKPGPAPQGTPKKRKGKRGKRK